MIMVIRTLAAVENEEEKDDGKEESIESMSLAKRLIIRPIGVVSKKDIGARKTPNRTE